MQRDGGFGILAVYRPLVVVVNGIPVGAVGGFGAGGRRDLCCLFEDLDQLVLAQHGGKHLIIQIHRRVVYIHTLALVVFGKHVELLVGIGNAEGEGERIGVAVHIRTVYGGEVLIVPEDFVLVDRLAVNVGHILIRDQVPDAEEGV